MFARQRGVTFLGWLILLVPVAILLYAGIRLSPVYLNYLKVARSIEQTSQQLKDEDPLTPQTIRNTLQKHFDIESVDYPTVRDMDIRRDGQSWILQVQYDDVAPLFENVSLLVRFDKLATIE